MLLASWVTLCYFVNVNSFGLILKLRIFYGTPKETLIYNPFFGGNRLFWERCLRSVMLFRLRLLRMDRCKQSYDDFVMKSKVETKLNQLVHSHFQ